MRRNVLTIAGLLMIAFGALFALQGLGAIRWPASSFMIDTRPWIFRGAIIAAIGLVLLVLARLSPPRTGRR